MCVCVFIYMYIFIYVYTMLYYHSIMLSLSPGAYLLLPEPR